MTDQQHVCDQSDDTRGGVLSGLRIVRIMLACLGAGDPADVLDEMAGCRQCQLQVTVGLAGFAAAAALQCNASARMGMELRAAALAAALDRGQVEIDADGNF